MLVGQVAPVLQGQIVRPRELPALDLNRIVKYKKRTIAHRRAGLAELREAIVSQFESAVPTLVRGPLLEQLVSRRLDVLRGAALKAYEDSLDALLCAFIAAHYWAWGGERNEMIGSMSDGYIVTPTRTAQGRLWSFDHPMNAR